MDIMNKMSSSMGFVPLADSKAQERCYDYMKETVKVLNEEIVRLGGSIDEEEQRDVDKNPVPPASSGPMGSEDPLTLCQNQKRLIESQLGFTEANAGGHFKYKAHAFWQFWDKSKESIIRTRMTIENNLDHVVRGKIFDKIQELEAGRYKEDES